ncbi:MAG: hypothetical protein RR416_01640 [Clostridia bacterium]
MENEILKRLEMLENRLNDRDESRRSEITTLINAQNGICEKTYNLLCGGSSFNLVVECLPKENCSVAVDVDGVAYPTFVGCLWTKTASLGKGNHIVKVKVTNAFGMKIVVSGWRIVER